MRSQKPIIDIQVFLKGVENMSVKVFRSSRRRVRILVGDLKQLKAGKRIRVSPKVKVVFEGSSVHQPVYKNRKQR